MNKRTIIYVVTCWHDNKEPIVTVFDNEGAAIICYRYMCETYDNVILDETVLYSTFTSNKEQIK